MKDNIINVDFSLKKSSSKKNLKISLKVTLKKIILHFKSKDKDAHKVIVYENYKHAL